MTRVLRTRRFSLVASLCLVLAGASRLEAANSCVSGLFTQSASRPAAPQSARDTFTIASLNIAGERRIADVLTAWTQNRAVDVLLLQEVGHRAKDGELFASALAERLGYHVAYALAHHLEDEATQGLAIVSRYPLDQVRVVPLKYHQLRFRSRCRIALGAKAATTAGPVHLVNVHLDVRINSHDRVEQLAPVIDGLEGTNGAQVIGGDLNTMDVRWLRSTWPFPFLQRQAEAVRALFTSNGFDSPFTSTPSTFRVLGFPLKLDWLYLKRLQPLDWNVDDVQFSDHRGIWAHVRSNPTPSVTAQ